MVVFLSSSASAWCC